MNPRVAALLAALLVWLPASAALAQTPHHPPANDPVGTYDIAFDFGGQVMPAVLTISGQARERRGSLELHGEVLTFETVAVKGHHVTLTTSHESEFSMKLTLDAQGKVEGTFSVHGSSGTLTGTRRKS